MGIQIEFNPDLALRNIKEFKAGRREETECIPKLLEVGKQYAFLKKGQRNYWLHGEIPLLETKGDQQLSPPRASIIIREVVHFVKNREVFTKGTYEVIEVFVDTKIHFEGFERVPPSRKGTPRG